MLSLPHGRILLTIGWILIVATVVGSLGPSLPQMGVKMSDKVLHFLGYFGLTMWFAGLYPRGRLWVIGLCFFFLGALLEVMQGTLTRNREMDVHDLMMNTLGIATAVAVALLGLREWAVRLEGWLTRRSTD